MPTSWVEPRFSKSKVDWAGRVLSAGLDTDEDVLKALAILSNWRAAHGYPLNTAQIVLRHRARRVATTALISQRHKREYSIVKKLAASATMRLSQMQDIAGCRAVMSTLNQVRSLQQHYKNEIRDDYIMEPAKSGYRSIHAVSKYQGKSKTAFDGLFVETQIRTALQHAWATAVETVDTFTGSDLKSGAGDGDWKRLFALIGSGFSILENCPHVPDTPTSLKRIVVEIRSLEADLNLMTSLRAWRNTAQLVRDPAFRFRKYLIIEQRPSNGVVKLYTFGAGQFDEASQKYSELEQEVTKQNRLQVVMASADSFKALKRAYPNLFVDPAEFLKAYDLLLDR